MHPIGIRELRSNVAQMVRRARAGERIVISVDGSPIAQLGPLAPSGDGFTLLDLAGAGLIEPPRRHDRLPAPAPLPIAADLRVDRLVEQVRGR